MVAKLKKSDLEEIFSVLNEVEEDVTVPKNVREKVKKIKDILRDDKTEAPIVIDRALHELEEINEDINLDSFTRMKLFNVASMLESLAR